jgi:hypothetical protein
MEYLILLLNEHSQQVITPKVSISATNTAKIEDEMGLKAFVEASAGKFTHTNFSYNAAVLQNSKLDSSVMYRCSFESAGEQYQDSVALLWNGESTELLEIKNSFASTINKITDSLKVYSFGTSGRYVFLTDQKYKHIKPITTNQLTQVGQIEVVIDSSANDNNETKATKSAESFVEGKIAHYIQEGYIDQAGIKRYKNYQGFITNLRSFNSTYKAQNLEEVFPFFKNTYSLPITALAITTDYKLTKKMISSVFNKFLPNETIEYADAFDNDSLMLVSVNAIPYYFDTSTKNFVKEGLLSKELGTYYNNKPETYTFNTIFTDLGRQEKLVQRIDRDTLFTTKLPEDEYYEFMEVYLPTIDIKTLQNWSKALEDSKLVKEFASEQDRNLMIAKARKANLASDIKELAQYNKIRLNTRAEFYHYQDQDNYDIYGANLFEYVSDGLITLDSFKSNFDDISGPLSENSKQKSFTFKVSFTFKGVPFNKLYKIPNVLELDTMTLQNSVATDICAFINKQLIAKKLSSKQLFYDGHENFLFLEPKQYEQLKNYLLH